MKYKISALLLIMALSFMACPGMAAEKIPEPEGWVSDYAGVISPGYREKIESVIRELEESTSAEIAVVTVESIAPHDERSYARLIFDNWKIGKKGKDNGVLVLLAIKERRWRIETGYGAEAVLPDGKCGEIGRDVMVPLLKEGKYGEGLYYGVVEIARAFAEDAGKSLGTVSGIPRPERVRGDKTPIFFLSLFIPIFFFIWNLPWPVYIGLPFTLFFAFIFSSISPFLGLLAIGSYIASMLFRFFYWKKLPSHKRTNYFGTQTYGGRISTSSGGWGSGGGGGGFGGGGGGGGGSGGGF